MSKPPPTALVTGATGGIGLATARGLADRGFHVLLHGRSQEKAAAAARQIGRNVSPVAADLAVQSEIHLLSRYVQRNFPPLDVLVNNAGVWNSHRTLTPDGIEQTLAVNHLAYFLLTGLLRPHLRPAARILCVASDSHRQVSGFNFADPGLERGYHGLKSYAQSKLANVLFCYEYDRRVGDGTTICAIQPGLVQTDIGLKGNTWLHRLAWRVRRNMGGHKTAAEGAATTVFLATTPEAPPSGLYWDDCQPKRSCSSSYDEVEARRLWTLSEELTGFRFPTGSGTSCR
jgi:NAD(P)-dependent dehydrogenase (short-subunit alcohol dehydrogenase family)